MPSSGYRRNLLPPGSPHPRALGGRAGSRERGAISRRLGPRRTPTSRSSCRPTISPERLPRALRWLDRASDRMGRADSPAVCQLPGADRNAGMRGRFLAGLSRPVDTFDVGAAVLYAEASKAIAAVADMVVKNDLKLSITGYAGRRVGRRIVMNSRGAASTVRDALNVAGVADSSIELRSPRFVGNRGCRKRR